MRKKTGFNCLVLIAHVLFNCLVIHELIYFKYKISCPKYYTLNKLKERQGEGEGAGDCM